MRCGSLIVQRSHHSAATLLITVLRYCWWSVEAFKRSIHKPTKCTLHILVVFHSGQTRPKGNQLKGDSHATCDSQLFIRFFVSYTVRNDSQFPWNPKVVRWYSALALMASIRPTVELSLVTLERELLLMTLVTCLVTVRHRVGFGLRKRRSAWQV